MSKKLGKVVGDLLVIPGERRPYELIPAVKLIWCFKCALWDEGVGKQKCIDLSKQLYGCYCGCLINQFFPGEAGTHIFKRRENTIFICYE